MAKVGKGGLKSRTIVGGLLSQLPLLVMLSNELAQILPGQGAAVAASVGGVLAIVGRILASEPIRGLW